MACFSLQFVKTHLSCRRLSNKALTCKRSLQDLDRADAFRACLPQEKEPHAAVSQVARDTLCSALGCQWEKSPYTAKLTNSPSQAVQWEGLTRTICQCRTQRDSMLIRL